ncbi:MAG TPA: hypothetical protein DDY64_00530 [Streptococcus sp.]|nr:hypothetical protein [Streptococcus sp.]
MILQKLQDAQRRTVFMAQPANIFYQNPIGKSLPHRSLRLPQSHSDQCSAGTHILQHPNVNPKAQNISLQKQEPQNYQ